MTPEGPALPVPPGLRVRFRTAGEKIEWTSTRTSAGNDGGRRRRRARLRDEEAAVEEWGSEAEGGVAVDSSPLGALLLLLAADRRGLPTALGASHAGRDPGFPEGAIVAVWGRGTAPSDDHPRFEDVVDLARYALE